MRDVLFIGAASGWGAPDNGCGKGPDALLEKGYLPCFQQLEQKICHPIKLLHPQCDPYCQPLQAITNICTRLCDEVADALGQRRFPIIIGGDHSCAIGSWAGVRRATRSQGEFGLIWVDAHMDSHTPRTSPSGQLHGMPLACLLGYGDPSLTKLADTTPSLRPENVCLLGVRSYEKEEQQLLARLGVRVITTAEIRRIGFAEAWQQAQQQVSLRTVGFGISIDLDAIDPREAPGVGSPERNGIHAQELIGALRALHDDPRLLALEITEYNPERDCDNTTAALVAELIGAIIADTDNTE